jgi:hypothetical protein
MLLSVNTCRLYGPTLMFWDESTKSCFRQPYCSIYTDMPVMSIQDALKNKFKPILYPLENIKNDDIYSWFGKDIEEIKIEKDAGGESILISYRNKGEEDFIPFSLYQYLLAFELKFDMFGWIPKGDACTVSNQDIKYKLT